MLKQTLATYKLEINLYYKTVGMRKIKSER